MSTKPGRRFDYTTVIGLPAAIAVVVVAQLLEGAPARALWQPTAALVVFGGTFVAVVVSYPTAVVKRTFSALQTVFFDQSEPTRAVVDRVLRYAQIARRTGALVLEQEIDRAPDPFLRAALTLAVDGTSATVTRQILEMESEARREHAEAPADVLETAAGYAPTLGILGAVLGLIHVMQSLSEPSKLGTGIAVAFVATVYGVASANLVLLPLATKLRGVARRAALNRELIIEGMTAVVEGLSPRLIEHKLQGYLVLTKESDAGRRVA